MGYTYELPPTFTDNVNQVLSATDLNVLRNDAILIDQLSYRWTAANEGSGSADTAIPGRNPKGNHRVWWGAFRHRPGMTTCTVVGTLTRAASENLEIRLNGVLKATISTAGAFTQNIDISTGYTAYSIIEVEVTKVGMTNSTGAYPIFSVYASPIVMDTAWPGVPTFATTFSMTLLNQLRDAADWLYERINAVPILPNLAHQWSPATHKVETFELYRGYVMRYHTEDRLRLWGNSVIANDAETLQIYVAGSLAATIPSSGTWGLNSVNNFFVDLDFGALGIAVGTQVTVLLRANVTNAATNEARQAAQEQTINSRYTLTGARAMPNAGYPVAAPPAAFPSNTTIAAETVRDRLNSIASMLSATKARIDAKPALWDRSYAMRRLYAMDRNQQTKLARRYPHRFVRRGERLVIRGKGVEIGWGAPQPKQTEAGLDYTDYEWTYHESVIDGDKIDTKIVYLDQFERLFPGMAYYLTGDVIYAAEHIKG